MLEVLKLDNYVTSDENKVTKDEWIRFLEVRQDGQHNMFSPQARNSANLNKDKWKTIMKNFDDLYEYWGDLNECI